MSIYRKDLAEQINQTIGKSLGIKQNKLIMTKETPKNGLHTEYYDSGQTRAEINYKDDEWHETGQKKLEGNYKDDKKHGKFTVWDKNGQIVSEANYKENKCIGKVKR